MVAEWGQSFADGHDATCFVSLMGQFSVSAQNTAASFAKLHMSGMGQLHGDTTSDEIVGTIDHDEGTINGMETEFKCSIRNGVDLELRSSAHNQNVRT